MLAIHAADTDSAHEPLGLADPAMAQAQLERVTADLGRMYRERNEALRALARAHHEALLRLSIAAEYRDDDTGVHIVRMGFLAEALALALGQPRSWARLLRMADVYMAKITPRAHREPMAPLLASRQLFQQEAGSPLAMAMVKAIGAHPPGSLVQLRSGEVAVVKRRAAGGGPSPLVLTISDALGQPSVNSHEVDTAQEAHRIAGQAAEPRRFGRLPGERVYGLLPP